MRSRILAAWSALVAELKTIGDPVDRTLNEGGMEIMGDDSVGWSARFPGDPNWVWSGSSRATAVRGCNLRRKEVEDGKLVRGPTGYYTK